MSEAILGCTIRSKDPTEKDRKALFGEIKGAISKDFSIYWAKNVEDKDGLTFFLTGTTLSPEELMETWDALWAILTPLKQRFCFSAYSELYGKALTREFENHKKEEKPE